MRLHLSFSKARIVTLRAVEVYLGRVDSSNMNQECSFFSKQFITNGTLESHVVLAL